MRSFVVALLGLIAVASAANLAGGKFNTVCHGDKVDGRQLQLPTLKKDNCASGTAQCKFVNDPHVYIYNKWVAEAQKAGYNWVAYHMDGDKPVRVQMLTNGGNSKWTTAGGIAMHLPNGNFFKVLGRNDAYINCKKATAATLKQNGITVAGATYSVKMGKTHVAYAYQSLQVNTPECALRKSHGWCSASWNKNFQACLYSVAGKNPGYVKNEHNYFNCKSGLQDEITKEQKDIIKKDPKVTKCTEAQNAQNLRSCAAALGQFSEKKCSKKMFLDSCAADLCINRADLHEGLLRITQRNYLMHYGGMDRCLTKIIPKKECKTGNRKSHLKACYKALDAYDTLVCDKTNFVKQCMDEMCKNGESNSILKQMKKDYLNTFGGEKKCSKTAEIIRQQEKTKEITKVWQKLLHEQTVHTTKITEMTTEKHTTVITNKISTLQKIFERELISMKKEIKLMSSNMNKFAQKPRSHHTHININIKNGDMSGNQKIYRKLAARESALRRKEIQLNMIRRAVLMRRLRIIVHHRHSFNMYRKLPVSWLTRIHRKFRVVYKNWKNVCEEYKPSVSDKKRSPK
jgi:hypothetical protein